jgi:hypothetical protein
VTPDQLRKLADEQEARGHECRDRGDVEGAIAAYSQAEVNRRVADGLERLRKAPEMGTLGTMQMAADVRSRGAAVSAAKTDPKHRTPFQEALQERNLSLPEWVAKHKGLKLNTAKSWTKRQGFGGRPVPAAWARRIASEFSLPQLLLPESWPCGIRD